MKFEFASAHRILFGPGVRDRLAGETAQFGARPLVVSGSRAGRIAGLIEQLDAAKLVVTPFLVGGEPTVALVEEGVETARRNGCGSVVSIGGGSAMDAGKAIAALTANPGEVLQYLEVIGGGRALSIAPLPFIAVPTTAGTGAEVTRNAVLASPAHRVKVSLRSPLMLPRLAVIDPELTYSMPPEVTASTGLDALTQLIEPFVSSRANPITDSFCREGIRRAAGSLQRVYENGEDIEARREMALCSLLGGMALANAALGVVHGFAGPIGGMFPAPHGMICARLLPFVMRTNIRALRERAPDSPALERYAEVARLLTGRPDASAADGVDWVEALCRDLKIRPLSDYGVTSADFADIVAKTQQAGSTKGNPLPLTDTELREVLELAL